LEWFEEQEASYKESVLPKWINARVSIEAGVGSGWHKYVGERGEIISLEHFGASASAGTLFKEYGFTSENIVAAAKRSIARN
jgi:transketolase